MRYKTTPSGSIPFMIPNPRPSWSFWYGHWFQLQQHHSCLQELFVIHTFQLVKLTLQFTSISFSHGCFLFIVSGHALVGHVLETFVVVDEFECQQKCMANKSCKSFNVLPDADLTRRICQLNNKTRQMKPGDFMKTKASSCYGSIKVSVSKKT